MFIREDALSAICTNDLTGPMADLVTDATVKLAPLTSFGSNLSEYQAMLTSWYDTVSFLLGI